MNAPAPASATEEFPNLVKAAAIRRLAAAGADRLSLEDVATEAELALDDIREHFASRDELLTALLIDAYNASGSAMEEADLRARENNVGPGGRFLAVARALREWALANRTEFTLVYGSPVPGYHAPQDTIGPASRTPGAFNPIVRAALEAGELTPARRRIPGPPLIRQEAVELFGTQPADPFADLLERGIVVWSNLIGLLIFEVFSRTHDSVRDQAAFFDYSVAVMAETIGLEVPAEGH